MDWIFELRFWHWWVVALVLGMLELFVPGAFFMWIGIAAAGVGLVLLIIPVLGWQAQFVLFAILSVGSIIGWVAWRKRHPGVRETSTLNRRGEQYVGRRFTLEAPIVNGEGKVRVDDSTWKIRGSDLAAGTTVKVVAVDGTALLVEPDA